MAVSLGATCSAAQRTSLTVDEVQMVPEGARGVHLGGRFDLGPEHPPLAKLLYGLVVAAKEPRFPSEALAITSSDLRPRYVYGAEFCRLNGPLEVGRPARAVAALFLVPLIVGAYAFTASACGFGAGLLAATLVAFLPDVLAHGGVAYNDLPAAPAVLLALWAIDVAARDPSGARGALAGALTGLALSIKLTASLLLPAAVALVVCEALVGGGGAAWRRRMLIACAAGVLAGYAVLVGVYLGDVGLEELTRAFRWTLRRASRADAAHQVAQGYLLGELRIDGWRTFYPIAFLFKTPAGFHVLLVVAAAAGLLAARAAGWRAALRSPLRVPALGGVVLLAALLASRLNIGFRHALAGLPLLAVLTAAGAAYALHRGGRPLRALVGLALAAHVASSLSFYPHFLAYTSEYVRADRGYTVLADSSLDWGQGLLELRRWMEEEGVEEVWLDCFGPIAPDRYGIRWRPPTRPLLAPDAPPLAPGEPRWLAVSASNYVGILQVPPGRYAGARPPDRVVAHSILLFDLGAP